ncbi:MAG: hypothetical protein B7Y47_13100 [Sphingomonas sp. 28-63-12]|nr:MAG: hypothetical protein B7Y47_13100 [Sphingomonas sp. 28-63-12]
MLGRVIVPSGFMIAPGMAGAAPMIVICTGQGAMMMPMPSIGPKQPGHPSQGEHDGKAADHPCAFAAASASVDLAALSHPVAPVIIEASSTGVDRLAPRPGLGLAAPPPPKTGPPAHG